MIDLAGDPYDFKQYELYDLFHIVKTLYVNINNHDDMSLHRVDRDRSDLRGSLVELMLL